jgi:cation diffusion facilitator family transporter
MSGHGGDPKKVVKAALAANAGIAVAKFVAAYLSGSATMLAEGVHSLADTGNQGLLLLGILLSARKATSRHPFGRAAESYFWSFLVALLLFFLGGVFAIYEGIHKLSEHGVPGSPWVALAVLAVSIGMEGTSFLVAFKEFNKERGQRSITQALFEGKDPVIPVVLLEDTGAIIGLLIALISIGIAAITGDSRVDAVGSIVIGVLLCLIGLALARDTKSLLIGEGITDAMRVEVTGIIEAVPGVDKVGQLLSLHLGPRTILLALKVRFDEGSTLADVERVTNDLEDAVRAKIPEMTRIFVEPDSAYDASLDPLVAPLRGDGDGGPQSH